jgi:DNA-binding NarL/FixJ family response regulator
LICPIVTLVRYTPLAPVAVSVKTIDSRAPCSRAWSAARESLTVGLLSTGQTNGQIAGALAISRRTVENHLQSVYRKLGVTNRTAAVAAAAPQQPM